MFSAIIITITFIIFNILEIQPSKSVSALYLNIISKCFQEDFTNNCLSYGYLFLVIFHSVYPVGSVCTNFIMIGWIIAATLIIDSRVLFFRWTNIYIYTYYKTNFSAASVCLLTKNSKTITRIFMRFSPIDRVIIPENTGI